MITLFKSLQVLEQSLDSLVYLTMIRSQDYQYSDQVNLNVVSLVAEINLMSNT